MLSLQNISLRVAGRLLIDNASLTLPEGAKAGIVGQNGTGKSTLFRAILNETALEGGEIGLPRQCKIGQVAQEAPGTEEPLIDIVLKADQERTALLEEAQTASNPDRIAEIQARLVDIDAYSAQARAAAILAGLGFDHSAQQRPAASFSGGWRMRVALAAILFSRPDLLLLDEPTNYLDLEGTVWLENYIRHYPHTAIIISHDRDLLNNCVSSIIHLSQQKLTLFQGNYDQFARQKAEQDILQQKAKAKNEAARQHLENFVKRFKAKASKAKQAQSRIKALEKMGTIEAVVHDSVASFSFPNPDKQVSSPIIKLNGASCGYQPGAPILDHLNLRIDADDRIALLGMNGNGKSTFAKLLCDRLSTQKGELVRVAKLKIGFFAQHQLDDLHEGQSAFDHIKAMMPDAPDAKVRARIAQMGLTSEKMDTKVEQLSGGEKARLLMGIATFNAPHLLILDEPTNHLDIDSRTELTMALNAYEGAVILISHDRHLIEASVDRLWLVNEGTVQPYDGAMDDYRELVMGGHKKEPNDGKAKDKFTKAEQRKHAAALREKLKPLKRQITALEKNIQTIEGKIAQCDQSLADPDIYDKSPHKVAEISKLRGQLLSELEACETNWMELSERYEQAEIEAQSP